MTTSANEILVSVFARTDNGLRRAANEDAFIVADLTSGKSGLGPDVSSHRVGEKGSLMVVSDGMGGAAAGEVASEMAVKIIREELATPQTSQDICDYLSEAVKTANKRIWDHAAEDPKLTGMGATLTAVLVQSTSAYIAQVGDSRAYLIRGDQIKQLTKDQSLVQFLLESGAIEPEQASAVPQNVIIQALGTSETVEVAITTVELCRDDYLLVCSDGLSNKIGPDEMRSIAREDQDLITTCRRFIELANERGGEDNITVIVARFDGEALHSVSDKTSITGSFKVLDPGCLDGDPTRISRHSEAPAVTPAQAAEFTTLMFSALPAETTMPDDAPPALGAQAGDSNQTVNQSDNRSSFLIPIVSMLIGLLLLAAIAYYFLYLRR
jgi:serine/threonine protein phosphatase PrpC